MGSSAPPITQPAQARSAQRVGFSLPRRAAGSCEQGGEESLCLLVIPGNLGHDLFTARQDQRLSIFESSPRYQRACTQLCSEAEGSIFSLCRLGCASCLTKTGNCANWEHRERGRDVSGKDGVTESADESGSMGGTVRGRG